MIKVMLRMQKLLSLVVISGTMTCFIMGRDFFPFSNYPMYSKPFESDKPLAMWSIVGINEGGSVQPLKVWKYLKPFWQASLIEATLVEKEPAVIRKKMEAALLLYNKRAAALNQPDQIKAMRLYRHKVEWDDVIKSYQNKMASKRIRWNYSELIAETGL